MKGKKSKIAALGVLALLVLVAGSVQAMPGVIDGINGPDFILTAKSGYISTPEGNSVFFWGFANGDGTVQYPGPTLIVDQGDPVTVTLNNTLSVNVSIVFPGQGQVTTAPAGANIGLLTEEVPPGGTVVYSFTATHAGTYLYHSGTQTDLQVDMGLFGALIVRPATSNQAYDHPDSAYDWEYLFLLSEMDPNIHRLVERGMMGAVDTTTFFPAYWFINGRNAPDTMFPPFVGWLPTQPYNCMPMMRPGERMLLRIIGAGRSLHPFHHHGNHSRVIARDGRLLESVIGSSGADLSYEVFTVQSVPGQTVDTIFTWTGEGIGWDIYGHAPEDDPVDGEDPNDHGKPFPVLLPEKGDLTYGGFWSGSPFLGALGSLPPGEGGLNPMGGFAYMWHSHTEKEMTNNDIFPGGLMTMLIIVPPDAPMLAPPLEQGDQPIMGKEGGQ